MLSAKTVGIYIGAFDPIHSGHISFALQVSADYGFDSVYFLPERFPKNRPDITHHTHRVAMIRRAQKPYQQLGVVEVVDRRFSFMRTLPKLHQQFTGVNIALIVDAATFANLADTLKDLPRKFQIPPVVVSVRSSSESLEVSQVIQRHKLENAQISIRKSTRPNVSGRRVRGALALGIWTKGVLPSVRQYAREAWLYVRFPRR